MMSLRSHTYIVGSYKDEKPLFDAISSLKDQSIVIDDVYTPYPVHGLDAVLGMRQTKLHMAGFIYGAIGIAIILGFMSWVMLLDWPTNYGGKPFWALPGFIPMAFEFTVLCASVGMVLTFCYLCRLAPWVKKHHFHKKATDDTFVLVVDMAKQQLSKAKIIAAFKKVKADEINEQTANSDWWFGTYDTTKRLYEENKKTIHG